jgi:K+-sensing histidine kinase KdpD
VRDSEDTLFYAGGGALAAVLLGIALVPLRGLTPASNLGFAFMALTIVVAELGGPVAAVATASCSALSLDFFLTQPYLRLSIEDKHDVIAFVGLAVCGLIVAALSSQRERKLAALSAVAKHRELLRSVLTSWDATAPAESLSRALPAIRAAFPLAAAVVRDARGETVASADASDALRPVPDQALQTDSLLPASGEAPEAGLLALSLPRNGGRIALTAGARALGWLDVWGSGEPASVESRRALADVARLLALLLAGGSRGKEVARA